MEFPKVSIQIPTYNQASLLEAAIDSCLSQDYANIEINIADDGSSDNTSEVVKKYASDARVNYYKNSTNIGRVNNYRKALYEYATGDWVINLDGDDCFSNPHFISSSIKKIESNTDVLFLQGAHRILTLTQPAKMITHAFFKDGDVVKASDYFLSFFSNKHFSHLATLYNRELIIQTNFYANDLISTDIYSTLNACIEFPDKKVIVTDDIAGNWNIGHHNASKNITLKEHLKNTSAYYNLFKKYKNKLGRKKIYSWFVQGYLTAHLVYLKKKILSG